MHYKDKKSICGYKGCQNPRRPNQRRCRECHAAEMRKHRAERVSVKRRTNAGLPKFLSAAMAQSDSFGSLVERVKRHLIVGAVQAEGGDCKAAAAKLGIHRNTVTRALQGFGVKGKDIRQSVRGAA